MKLIKGTWKYNKHGHLLLCHIDDDPNDSGDSIIPSYEPRIGACIEIVRYKLLGLPIGVPVFKLTWLDSRIIKDISFSTEFAAKCFVITYYEIRKTSYGQGEDEYWVIHKEIKEEDNKQDKESLPIKGRIACDGCSKSFNEGDPGYEVVYCKYCGECSDYCNACEQEASGRRCHRCSKDWRERRGEKVRCNSCDKHFHLGTCGGLQFKCVECGEHRNYCDHCSYIVYDIMHGECHKCSNWSKKEYFKHCTCLKCKSKTNRKLEYECVGCGKEFYKGDINCIAQGIKGCFEVERI